MSYLDSGNSTILAQQARRESNARTYPRHLPLAIREAKGVTVTDMDGNEYYDCLAGAGTLALGHHHPCVAEAMERALDAERPIHTLDISTPAKERFVDSLFESLPEEFTDSARIQFCSPAGTDAVEAALKLVKTATGNRSILGFRGAYHGMTTGALSLMGDTDAKETLHEPAVHAERVEAVGDVRGRGLMLGVEFVDPDAEWQGAGPHAPDADFAATVQTECFERGLVIERGGRESATARFLPPLIVSKSQVDDIAAIFDEAVTATNTSVDDTEVAA